MTNFIKYPKTYHLPWSPGISKDDKIMKDISYLDCHIIEVTEKMDGENTTMYHDYIHARSINLNPHWSRSYVKSLHAKIKDKIPIGYRICGENMYAVHSIKYDNLKDYFLVFSIFNDKNICLSYDDTQDFCEMLGLKMVPHLYQGRLKDLHNPTLFKGIDVNKQEGYVVRPNSSFHFNEFNRMVAKWVRPNHVQTNEHWRNKKPEINQFIKHTNFLCLPE